MEKQILLIPIPNWRMRQNLIPVSKMRAETGLSDYKGIGLLSFINQISPAENHEGGRTVGFAGVAVS